MRFSVDHQGHLETLVQQENVVAQSEVQQVTRELRNYMTAHVPHLTSMFDCEMLVTAGQQFLFARGYSADRSSQFQQDMVSRAPRSWIDGGRNERG